MHRVMEESSDRMWSTGEGNGKPVFLPWEHYEQYEKAKDRTLKDELPRWVGAQYATGDQWRNNSRKNEEAEQSQSENNAQLWMCLVVEVKSDAVKSNIA